MKNNFNVMLGVAGVLVVSIFLLGFIFEEEYNPKPNSTDGDIGLKQFSDRQEFDSFLERSADVRNMAYYHYKSRGMLDFGVPMISGNLASEDMAMMADSSGSMKSGGAAEYSNTNIQVEGVDEADIVKNDDKYIYVVTGNKIVILNAFPVTDIGIVGEINFSSGYINEIFVNGDKLVVFGNGLVELNGSEKRIAPNYYPSYNNEPAVLVYDLGDRTKPELKDSYVLDGNYVDSRMIGDYVYVVSNKYLNLNYPEMPVFYVDDVREEVDVRSLYYPPYPDTSYQFTSVSAISLDDGEFNSETYLLGTSYTLYVSNENIYLTQAKSWEYEDYLVDLVNEVYLKVLPMEYDSKIESIMDANLTFYEKADQMDKVVRSYSESLDPDELAVFSRDLQDHLEAFNVEMTKKETTAIYKINVDDLDINYEVSGAVPGRLLNQFSMDEYEGNLRVATTTGNSWGDTSLNHIYVLDEGLEIIGSVEDLAKGEMIYSARFIGERAYMVTFRQTDPLFAVDLSDPENPQVMGYLKITGFSDYLHPYDENHLIGIGKEATEGGQVQGLKVALFDVSDIENPTETARFLIGDRGTNSEALNDHKAVLFDKEKGILVLPVSLYESSGRNSWGEYVWEGVFVLNIDENGISERGRIAHRDYSNKKYGSASLEPIGAEREDSSGNVWIKVRPESVSRHESELDFYKEMGTWVMVEDPLNVGDVGKIIVHDSGVDRWPGGVNYNRYPNYEDKIRRSLYLDDVLYTVSQNKVKANWLGGLSEIKTIEINEGSDDYGPYYTTRTGGIIEPMLREV